MSAKWLKAVLWLVCLVFFSVQSYNIFQQYGERATTMTIGQKVEDTLELPSITICHKSKFTNGNLNASDVTEEIFQSLALKKGDVFANFSQAYKWWNVTELRSFILGRCYVLRFKHPVKTNDFRTELNISLTRKLTLFVHQPGDEIWLFAAVPLINRMPSFEIIRAPGWTDFYFKQEVVLRNPDSGAGKGKDDYCKNYPDRFDFTSCVRQNMIDILRRKAVCWLPEYEYFMKRSDLRLPYCTGAKGRTSAWAINTAVLNKSLVMSGCPQPCTTTSYQPYMKNTHAENYAPQGLSLFFFYDSTVVTIRKQVLLYNLPQMLSAAGGTLGMYLGLSLYSVLSDSLDWSGLMRKQ